jgi:hypothetical protein
MKTPGGKTECAACGSSNVAYEGTMRYARLELFERLVELGRELVTSLPCFRPDVEEGLEGEE